MSRCASTALVVLTLTPLGSLFAPAAHGATGDPEGVLEWTFHAPAYRLVPVDGATRIELEGGGSLQTPGTPALPAKTVTLALPPGARATSVSVVAVDGTLLPGVHRIPPTPSPVLLVDPPQQRLEQERMSREWTRNRDAVYSTDRAFPASICELTGTGSLRKYAYAKIAIHPFTYQPVSGRLVHNETVRIAVHYRLPRPGSAEARHQALLNVFDRSAHERALGIFSNPTALGTYGPAPPCTPISSFQSNYLIITDDLLVDSILASGFPAWKDSLGYSLRLVTTSDPIITNQPGPFLSQKIRQFLRKVYGPWGVEYVLLVGGVSDVPMRYCFPDPSNHANTWWNPNSYGGAVPTDHYYADLSDPESAGWDSDGDGYCGEYGEDDPDFLAEVYVGRIPTSNANRITQALDKLVAFEQDTGTWKDQVLHGGAILFFENQDYGGVPFICGCRCLAAIENDLMSGMTITHYSEQAGIVTSPWLWPALTEGNFIGSWVSGQYGYVNWSGHGSPNGAWRAIWDWDDGDGVFESDGSDGTTWLPFVSGSSSLDDDHPSIVFAISCHVGYPEITGHGNLGVDLLTKPGFGAAAGILSASRPAAISVDFDADPWGAEGFAYEFNRQMIELGRPAGEATFEAKWHVHANHGKDHVYEHQNIFDYNWYGDPALVP